MVSKLTLKLVLYISLVTSIVLFGHIIYVMVDMLSREATDAPNFIRQEGDHAQRVLDKKQDIFRKMASGQNHVDLAARVDAALRHGWAEEQVAFEIQAEDARYTHFVPEGEKPIDVDTDIMRDSSVKALFIFAGWLKTAFPGRLIDYVLVGPSVLGASRPFHEQPKNHPTVHIMMKLEDLKMIDEFINGGADGPAPGTHVLLMHNGIEMHWTPFVFIDARVGAHVQIHAFRFTKNADPGHSVLRANGIGRVVKDDYVFPSKSCQFEHKFAKCPRDTLAFIRDVYGAEALSQEQKYDLMMRGED